MAVAFASLGGFADVRGMGISTEYLAQRLGTVGTSGWTTHAITPPQEPLSIRAVAQSLDPLYEGDMAPDLSQAVFRAWSPLTPAPNVRDVANLYVRTDLRSPGAGFYRLVTDAPALLAPLAAGTDRPYLAAASDDFEHVLFESRQALAPGASRGNVMLYKADGGVVRLVAAGATCPSVPGPPFGEPSAPCAVAGLGVSALKRTERTLSADGSRVLFTSPVTLTGNVATVPGAESRLYQLDDQGTLAGGDDTVVQVNASEKAISDPPQAASFQTASTDGERVLFTSNEELTDAPGAGLYLWEREAGADGRHLTLIAATDEAAVVGASRDARRLYLTAREQLVPGGPPVSQQALFLWQAAGGGGAGTLSFVGALSFGDATSNGNGAPWNLRPRLSRTTPDAGALLFTTSDGAELAPGRDHGSCPRNVNLVSNGQCSELYLYRAATSSPLDPDLVCVSCPPPGVAPTANAFVNVRAGAGASQVTTHLSRALADDGRRVFFSSAQALVAADANGKVDAYEYDAPSGTVRLLSSGRDVDDALFMDASASGDDAFFLTRARLVGWDVDQAYDLYDARVGGGFPEPPASPAPCAGDACRGLPSAVAPLLPALGSVALAGGERARPFPPRARRCRRGFVKKRVRGKRRCVKRARATRTRSRRRGR